VGKQRYNNLLIFPVWEYKNVGGTKSTKEKFMKKKFIIILIVLLTFSFTFIACNDNKADSALNGTWVSSINEYKFNNGEYTASYFGVAAVMGIYTTSDNTITFEPTQMNLGAITGRDVVLWCSIEQLLGLSSIELGPLDEVTIIEMFRLITSSYFIDGKYLFIIDYDENGTIKGGVPTVYIRI
jgi:hypothetical protein